MTASPLVRRCADTDVEDVLRLTGAESWGYDAADVHRLRSLSPDGFLVLEHDGRVRGCLSVLFYETIAWIGNVVVDQADRGRGFARALMDEALALCDRRSAPHVYLDAYPPAKGLYDRLGFVEETRTERWAATLAPADASHARASVIPLSAIEAVSAHDARVFGASRRALWSAMLADFPSSCWWITDGDDPRAWMAVRAGSGAAEIGPWCGESDAAPALFADACARLGGYAVELSAPADNRAARSALESAGFRVVGYHIRMWRGAPVSWDRARTWGIGGLEKG